MTPLFRPASITLALAMCLLAASPALAHFGMVIPSTNAVDEKAKSVDLTLAFAHPMEMEGMNLVKPKAFFVVADDKQTDLLPSLKETKVMDHTAWTASYAVARPGVYTFVMEPTPYWEPAEDCSIIHYTKTIVAAFGEEEGWDKPVGLKTEILPLTRPFGNYAGYSFTGQVLVDGKPVPNATVEVELYNEKKTITPPTPYHVTHVVQADANGVFTFACPRGGWWGFAALTEAAETLPDPSGAQKPVEQGAVLWIKMDEWKTKK
ncbi:DUF4198 domain-containing protein [Megalodesulfovibrio paquesii]